MIVKNISNHIKNSLTVLTVLAFLPAVFMIMLPAKAYSQAEQRTPASGVYVDRSVLEQLGHFDPAHEGAQLPGQPSLARSHRRPPRPILTNPDTGVTYYETSIRESGSQGLNPTGSVSTPVAKTPPPASPYENAPSTGRFAPSYSPRHESAPNPASNLATMGQADEQIIRAEQQRPPQRTVAQETTQNIAAPLPQLKPDLMPDIEPAVKPGTRKSQKTAAITPPVPPRRPDIQTASRSFVEQARRNHGMDASAIEVSGREGPPVKAAPKGRVYAERLEKHPAHHPVARHDTRQSGNNQKTERITAVASGRAGENTGHKPDPLDTDPLAKNLVTPDRLEMARMIEPAAGAAKIEKTPPPAASQSDHATPARYAPRPPPESGHDQNYISMAFAPGTTEIDSNLVATLNDGILPLLKNNPHLRIQIQAFASPHDDGHSSARRLSLSRALSVRSHLLEHGIEARRMDVRALGMQTDRAPLDRVDMVFSNGAFETESH